MRNYIRLLILVIVFIYGCDNLKDSTANKKQFAIINNNIIIYDSIINNNIAYGNRKIYTDKDFTITNFDFGEWGGFVQFKDSITKHKYVLPLNSVYQLGKLNGNYIIFSYSRHAGYGNIYQINNPKNLYLIPDTTTVFSSDLKTQIKSYYDNVKIKGLFNLSEEKDSIYSLVGIFLNSNKIYAVQSNQFGINNNSIQLQTVISEVNLKDKKTIILDTIFNLNIFPSSTVSHNNLDSDLQIINYEIPPYSANNSLKKGLLILKHDSIFIINKN